MSKKRTNGANSFCLIYWIFLFIYLLFMSSTSGNLGFMIFENQSFKVSTVNFNPTENNSAKDVPFYLANAVEAASFNK